jgi:hypothetical protein
LLRAARERAREHAGTRGHAELRQQWACARLAQEQISHLDKPTGETQGSPLLSWARAKAIGNRLWNFETKQSGSSASA